MRTFVVLVAGLALIGIVDAAHADGRNVHRVELAQAAAPLVSGERVRVKKLARDMESAMRTLDQGGVRPFQDPAYAAKWRQSVERFRAALRRYPQTDDPDVRTAAAKLTELENMVAFGTKEAARQNDELGDVQERLAKIEADLRAHRAPPWLPAPFSDDEVAAWIRTAATAKNAARQAVQEIQRIAPVANLPPNPGAVQDGAPYDKQDLDRLLHFAGGISRDVDDAVKQTFETLKHRFSEQNRELDYYRELDPANEQHRMNAFLREGAEAEIYAGLDRHLAFAKSVMAYQRALGKNPTAGSVARIDEIAALRHAYAANRLKALGASRLPKAKSTDADRVAIAEKILANPDYRFGEHGPIVLTTADIVEKSKTVGRADIKDVDVSLSGTITLSGTETTWNYAWKEFKFATPVKETGKNEWYVWWITAKNFSSGWERTPIGVWVSGGATKGDRILPVNFTR